MRLPRLLSASAALMVAGALALPSAQAEPEVTERQVADYFHKAEVMNEKVNALDEKVSKVQDQIDALNRTISADQKVYNRQRAALAELTVSEQLEAPLGTTASLLASRDSDEFLEGLGAVQALNSTRSDVLEAYEITSAKLDARRTQLSERRGSLAKQQKAADAKRKDLTEQYKEAKAKLDALPDPVQLRMNKSNVDADFKISATGAAKKAIAFAMDQLGDPYVYGGTGPDGWDCSGLVQASYRAAGVQLPRVVGPQMNAVRRVPMSQLKPGDLVAYADMSHNGMYLGNGRVIHSPRPGKTVEIAGMYGFSVAGRVG